MLINFDPYLAIRVAFTLWVFVILRPLPIVVYKEKLKSIFILVFVISKKIPTYSIYFLGFYLKLEEMEKGIISPTSIPGIEHQ